MWSASQQATGDWLLFTDADVQFKPDSVRRAIAYAEAEPADHVVLFPRMIMKQPGEKMMTAFFQTLFVFGHRPWKVADAHVVSDRKSTRLNSCHGYISYAVFCLKKKKKIKDRK